MPGQTEIDYRFPGKEGLLDPPVYIAGSDIKIVRAYDGRGIKKALFDLDGTLSTQRHGWVNLMVACNASALAQAVGISPKEAEEWALGDIEETVGLPTYTQMRRLADEIRRRGGEAKSPGHYKEVYVSALNNMVATRNKMLQRGELQPDDLMVRGAGEFLKRMEERLGKGNLYLGSGTDIGPVLETVGLFGLGGFFGEEDIVAAGRTGGPEVCAKEMIIRKLIEEHGLQPGEMACFGDGFPEIIHGYRTAKGPAFGLVTPDGGNYEGSGHFTAGKKEGRLISAGACAVFPDFSHSGILIDKVIFSRWP